MSRKFERTFTLTVPVARAWQAFTEADELAVWWGTRVDEFEARPGGALRGAIELPGGDVVVEGEIQEVDPERYIRWTEEPGLLPGRTEVSVTFESVPDGTRVTIIQAGFGEGDEWLGQLESHSLGWHQCIADLQLYLTTGVRFTRMFTWKTTLGAATADTPGGVEVQRILNGFYAERAGLKPGDILLQLGQAPVFTRSDRWLFEREHAPGEEVEVTFVRDGEVQRAKAEF